MAFRTSHERTFKACYERTKVGTAEQMLADLDWHDVGDMVRRSLSDLREAAMEVQGFRVLEPALCLYLLCLCIACGLMNAREGFDVEGTAILGEALM
jgi:hypothetical protein